MPSAAAALLLLLTVGAWGGSVGSGNHDAYAFFAANASPTAGAEAENDGEDSSADTLLASMLADSVGSTTKKMKKRANNAVGDDDADEHPLEVLNAIKCPLCDYTASFLVKAALDAQRLCGRKSVEAFKPIVFRSAIPSNTVGATRGERRAAAEGPDAGVDAEAVLQADPSAAGSREDSAGGEDEDGCVRYIHSFSAADGIGGGGPKSGDEGAEEANPSKEYVSIVASKRTIGRLYDRACRGGSNGQSGKDNKAEAMVMRAFPIGTRAAPRHTEEDTRPDAERLADLERHRPEPADDRFRRAITHSCASAFEKLTVPQRKRMKRLLYDLSLTGAADGAAWDEVDALGGGGEPAQGPTLYARRNGDYQRILTFQKRLCFKACGEFPRPVRASPNPQLRKGSSGGKGNSVVDLMERPEKPKKQEDSDVSYIGLISWNALGEVISREHI